ncbi:MAG: multidrug efflux RND transporter permease subunit [Syntrophaceae bacterium]|jgi:multidrug efflux pump|nr:multidrug efflux RND transporter permease subunit [Syntrophaceae bacterium]
MNISSPFIKRPVATTLITLGLALAGLVAFKLLPVAALPQVDFPTIAVMAYLPGASPETMAATVATPLERSLGRIAGVTEMTSTSSLGSTRIILQFDLNRNIDGAARDVQAAINGARSLLPTGMPTNPIYRKVNPADAPILILAMTSETMTRGQLYDAGSTVLAQKLSQVKGVGQVHVGGSSLPAVRVELNPALLNRYGISAEQVRLAIYASNANRPKGAVEAGDRHWQIYANDQAKKARDYIPLIVSYKNGAAVRLSDLGEVVDSVQDVRNAGFFNLKPSVLLMIYKQPGANVIETVDRIKDLLPMLRASIPTAVDLQISSDRTPTIRASLTEVERTLLISIGLVIMVVFLFLRNARSTLIPGVAVPVSLIGTFGVMYLAGYTLDNLSLMALTVATGFVVDDAIVVLENISRHVEAGMKPFQAALLGAREVGFTVLSMSLSLIAVFIPILLMGGIVGRLFREFAVTLSAAVIISLLVSLSLTPMMCSRMLKAQDETAAGWFSRKSRRIFDAVQNFYKRTLGWALSHSAFTLFTLFVVIALNIVLYKIIPMGFFPQQDTGAVTGMIQADQNISFQAMQRKLIVMMRIIKNDPAVEKLSGFTGGGQRNSGFIFITLKPAEERGIPAEQVIARLRPKLARVPGARIYLQPVQDIRTGGRSAGAMYQYTLQADDLGELRQWEKRIRDAMNELPQLADVNTDEQDRGLQTTVAINRDAASRMNITPAMTDTTLNNYFGQRQVSTIYNPLNQYRVIMEAAPPHWQSPESLKDVYVIIPPGTQYPKGAQIPLLSFAGYELTNTPLAVNHQGSYAASTISFNLPPGVSLSQATEAIQKTMQQLNVSTSVRGNFQGTARTFQKSLENQPWLILAALCAVYIVLGILYESYVHPLTILSTLPSAGVGALLALLIFGVEFSIMALIGVILLIGIVKKNAILMIDFALDRERRGGMSPQEAIYQACLMRFRPIMMTTLAAIFGAIPLIVFTGAGSELRQPLGISIVGGLVVSQMLTLYTTPVVYLYLDRFRLFCLGALGRRKQRQAQAAETIS